MACIKANGFYKLGPLPEEVFQLLVRLGETLEDVVNPHDIEVVHLSGAMTNKVYQITWPSKEVSSSTVSRKVLLRIYGEGVEVFFDREVEIRTFECMSKHGQGPQLLWRFPEGRVEEFIHARTLSAPDLREHGISTRIAAKLREFHNLDMPGSKEPYLWDRIRKWVKNANGICTPQDVKEFGLNYLEGEIHMLEAELTQKGQELGFCHNDLQYGNIMMDDDTGSITLIDYEYASYNVVAYDLANHFCEMAADYHSEKPHILDYSKYPDLEERKRFARAYLNSPGEEVNEYAVQQLIECAEKYTLANHLFWGLWGLISYYVNKIEFDYKEYARQRFRQYWLRKPSLVGTAKEALLFVDHNGKEND